MRLYELRKKAKITQKQISDELGISVQNYSRYERNEVEPDYFTLKLFADYFNVSLDYLLERNDDDLFIQSKADIETTKTEIQEAYEKLDEPQQRMVLKYTEELYNMQERMYESAKNRENSTNYQKTSRNSASDYKIIQK